MANLTPAQEEQRLKRLSEIPEEKSNNDDAIVQTQEAQVELNKTQDLDSAFWDVLNDGIVRRYEKERRWINGTDDNNPVSLSEIKNVPEGSGRLFDQSVFDVVRVSNFDGGDIQTGLTPKEDDVFSRDDRAFDWLINGFSDGPDPTGLTSTIINDASTSFETNNSTNIVAGRRYLISGNNSAVIFVSGIESTTSGATPPFEVTFSFYETDDVIFNTNGGGINTGASILGARVFSNSERTSQTASPAGDQNTLDNSFQLLIDSLGFRRGLIQNQLQEIAQNQDSNIDATYVSGLIGVAEDIDDFLLNTDFSNSGLTSIETILSDRDSSMALRVTSILNQLNGVQQSYYDTRYGQAQTIGSRIFGSYSKYFYSLNSEQILQQIGQNITNVSGVYTNL